MTTLEALYASLTDSLDDWQTRAILADWYEDAGQQAVADAIRWMIRHRKRPFRGSTGTYHWFNDGRPEKREDPESDIPEPVYLRMSGKEGLAMVFRDYETLRGADEDFYAAWGAARQQGWAADA